MHISHAPDARAQQIITLQEGHVPSLLRSDWPRTIFNVGTRKCSFFCLGGADVQDYLQL
jgi:hypothetical protein